MNQRMRLYVLLMTCLSPAKILKLSARAVIERDLNKIRARRIERENAKRLLTSRASIPEDAIQGQDFLMQDYPEASPGEDPDPDETLVDIHIDQAISESNKPHAFGSQDLQADQQDSQGLKDISLDDDDLFGGETDAFGPDNGDTNFDFTAGGDFDMDFSIPVEAANPVATSTQSIPDPTAPVGSAIPGTLADNDLLLHDFGDINATSDMHTNEFGDIDFDHVNSAQDDTNGGNNPFGSINTDDDDFSFFDS